MDKNKQMREALEAYESAREQLFMHCLSNGVFNAWGHAMDCTQLNDAHLLASDALRATAAQTCAVPDEVMRALKDARDIAMKQCVAARVPECGEFAAIAQDLEVVVRTLAAMSSQSKEPT